MADELKKPERPSDRFTVELVASEGQVKSKSVFMSGGLLRHLVSLSPSMDSIIDLHMDPNLQSAIIVEALRDRTDCGEGVKRQTIDDFQMTGEMTDKFIDWVVGHVLYFFIQSASKIKDAVSSPNSLLVNLVKSMDSVNGLKALTDQKPSAGPTDATTAT